MSNISLIRKNRSKLISYLEIGIGIIFLCFEIRDYITLYSTTEADEVFGGLVEFFKYKENTYSQIFLWTTLILTGISCWINKKLYWILTQVTLLLVFLKIGLPYFFRYYDRITIYIVPFLYLVVFVWIEIKFFRINKIESTIINKSIKILGVAIGLVCGEIYVILL